MSARRVEVINRHLNNIQCNPTSAFERPAIFSSQVGFRYTVDNPLLSYEQRKFYEENGFLLMKNMIEHELLDECSQHFIDICEGRAPRGNMTLMKDISFLKSDGSGQSVYNKAQDIHFDPVFSKYIDHERLLDYVECFTGPNIKAAHTMLINKPPDSGKKTSRHPLHQDLYYFPFRPAERIVAAWTAMEHISLANGCLVVIPGSHKDPPGGVLLQHDYPNWEGGVNKAYHGILGCDNYKTVPLIMDKGDTVFFHPLLIHGSGTNNTNGFRKAISCHYVSSNCYFIDVRGTIQDSIAKEIEGMARKKGLEVNIQEVWKYRSKLVRGREGTY